MLNNLNIDKIYLADLYIRLSKEDGDKAESNSISNQRDLIYSFLKEKEDIQVYEEKVDDGYSGVGFNRPALISMLEDVKQGKVNCIIVKDLSRFGRNYIETGRYIQQIFPFMGVRFIAINDHYDSEHMDSQTDNIILPFKNLMNDSYSRDISIKVRSQIEVRQKRGDYIGSFPVYGYFRDQERKGKLVIDYAAAEVVRDIFDMRIKGYNNRRIADYLNEHGIPSPMEYKMLLHWRYTTSFKLKAQAKWSPIAVERILKNEIYTGVMVQGKEKTLNYKVKKRIKVDKKEWIRVEDTHEAIITKEVFAIVQKLMLRDTRTAPDGKKLYLFSGLLRCGGCGGNMVRKKIRSAGSEYCYYICSNNKNDKSVCSSHRIREDFLRKAVLEMLRTHLSLVSTMDEMEGMIAKLPLQEQEVQKRCRQLEERRNELARYQKLKISVYEDYKETLLTPKEYLEMKEDYEVSCRQLEEAIETLEREVSLLVKDNGLHSPWIERLKDSGNISELDRGLLAMTVEEIIVMDSEHIKIHFKYRDEFEIVLQVLEAAMSVGDRKNISHVESEQMKRFLLAAREG
ncbi:MAG: recombinase family protein [Lachnospiraceae bacterium]|nr:recombinase family protein [uncultured Acetatifactor sp.]MCI9220189.1 recombinase family protein [Lachnospiraceae bacterium]